ncbi:hypothetical protein GCM10009821_12510 [Aeromicrobium halocynthiae]|uniref:DUF4333 domain-containing protein n=1 Tax=Aeromicrobium halocynthiae TaxID=560557 RepID=A0ABP5HFJ2_9ACTN
MRRPVVAACASLLLLGAAACDARTPTDVLGPTPSAVASAPTSIAEHESGPQTPIAYGLEVPEGATQLGPLVRLRSERLLAAYRPALDAALAQQEAAEAAQRAEAEESGEPIPTPAPTPETQPGRDTFAPIGTPPRPDTTIAVLRIDEDPTEALRLMIGQMNAVVPGAGLVTDDIGRYCEDEDGRVTSCRVEARGLTSDGRDVRLVVTADPGDAATRTGRAASRQSPVMTVTAEYVGDPRSGQVERETSTVQVPRSIDGEDRSGLIWPRMDLDAPSPEGLPFEWETPQQTTVLLSGVGPTFVAAAADRVRGADELAERFASGVGEPEVDVVEDLNEITTAYRSVDADGNVAVAAYVLSARGNYALMFYVPEGSTGPVDEGPIEPLGAAADDDR